MTDSAHASLTGADLHEPKGVDSASAQTVYVANGSGSGAWTGVAAFTSQTGQIAAFGRVTVPSGWLECDGSTPLRFDYPELWGALSITTTANKVNGQALLTGIPDTTGMQPGYYVSGTGIQSGTVIASVDSSTQITITPAASGTNGSSISVAPWGIGNGSTTFTLPNLVTDGRYLRSRTSSIQTGTYQADLVKGHMHTASGTTNGQNVSHHHTGTSDAGGVHSHSVTGGTIGGTSTFNNPGGGGVGTSLNATAFIAIANSASHTHTFTSNNESSDHTHTFSLTTDSNTGAENRPITAVVLYCIRT